MNFELSVVPEDAEEMSAKLASIPDLNISTSEQPSSTRDPRTAYDRSLNSASVELVSITIALIGTIRYIAPAIATVMVEYIRSRRRFLMIRRDDGTTITFSGPLSKEEASLAAKEIESYLLQNSSKQ